MALELTVKSKGSLLPVVFRQEITPAQLSMIRLLLKSDLSYGEALARIPNKVARPNEEAN